MGAYNAHEVRPPPNPRGFGGPDYRPHRTPSGSESSFHDIVDPVIVDPVIVDPVDIPVETVHMVTESTEHSEWCAAEGVTVAQYAAWHCNWSMQTPQEYISQSDAATQQTAEQSSGAQSDYPEETVHLGGNGKSEIMMKDRNAILVDVGSNINIIGEETLKAFVAKAKAAGRPPTKFINRSTQLNVNGVGSGSATCDMEAVMPIAVKYEDQPASSTSFRANVARGVGKNLPAILGATSMRAKDAVLVLRENREFLAFPGQGGYKIEWSPGTRLLPLTYSPSGHMVITCDHFDDLPTTTTEDQELSFWTDHRHNQQ